MSSMTVKYKASFGESRSKARSSETARISADRKPPVSRVARLLALAHYVERLVEDGTLKNYAEAARRLGMSRGRMTQVANLLNLSVSIQEGILVGGLESGERRIRSLVKHIVWQVQEPLASHLSTT